MKSKLKSCSYLVKRVSGQPQLTETNPNRLFLVLEFLIWFLSNFLNTFWINKFLNCGLKIFNNIPIKSKTFFVFLIIFFPSISNFIAECMVLKTWVFEKSMNYLVLEIKKNWLILSWLNLWVTTVFINNYCSTAWIRGGPGTGRDCPKIF